jgi:hypothetical protein
MATNQLSEMIIVMERDTLVQENQTLKLQIANITGQIEQLEKLLFEKDKELHI